MVVISKLVECEEYEPNVLQHLQKVELMILKDFIEFCDKFDITYFIDGGSALGCVRHQGFIPWDDDIDVILLRDQYEKFLEHCHELDNKYDILNMEDYEDYCRLYSKISLKKTRQGEIFDINTDFTFGINIDVFVLDNIPNPGFRRTIFKGMHKIFRETLRLYEITLSDIYISKNKEIIGHIIRAIFKIFNINNKTLKKWGKKLIENSKNIESGYVCNLATSYSLSAYRKSIFSSYKKSKFESMDVNLMLGYDEYLKIIYGSYMDLPPVEQRTNHKYEGLDFGEY